MNLKKAFHTFVTGDVDLATLVGARVYRDRKMPKDATPAIVYAVDGATTNRIGAFQGAHGFRAHRLTADVIGKYEEADNLMAVRDLLRAKLGGFVGVLSSDWQGRVTVATELDLYDADTDSSVCRIEFLCKETF